MTRLHSTIFQVTGGRVLGRAGGMPVLMLTTTGRKSGKRQTCMLTSPVQVGDKIVLVASCRLGNHAATALAGDERVPSPAHPPRAIQARCSPAAPRLRQARPPHGAFPSGPARSPRTTVGSPDTMTATLRDPIAVYGCGRGCGRGLTGPQDPWAKGTMAAATTRTESPVPAVHGFVAPGFEAVRDAFAQNFAVHGEVGAACCVYRYGVPVVDIHAGLADRATGRPWRDDTLQLVFSATKAVTATCVLLLAERGRLDLDSPVARYWPEFAANGKERIPVRWLLSHRAGLAAIEGDFTLDQALSWTPVVTALAAQAPLWEPGTQHGYHLRSYGWLLGELIRRVDGRTLGRFLADEIAGPLGLDLWIGLPESEEARVSTIVPPEPPSHEIQQVMAKLFAPDSIAGRAFTGPSDLFHYDEMWNRRALHAAELPSSNGIGTARALARLYAALVGAGVGGRRILRDDTVAAACEVQSEGPDTVLFLPTRFGLGFMLPPALCASAGAAAFGHPGAGGSLAFADREHGIGFGYVMNRMTLATAGDPRADALVAALYRALGA